MGSSSSKFKKYLQHGDEYAAMQVYQNSGELRRWVVVTSGTRRHRIIVTQNTRAYSIPAGTRKYQIYPIFCIPFSSKKFSNFMWNFKKNKI